METLRHYSQQSEVESRPNPDQIISVVCGVYKIPVEQIRGPGRIREVVEARHVAMYLLRESALSLKEVGFKLGGRDHSTIIHGINRVERRMDREVKFKAMVETFKSELKIEGQLAEPRDPQNLIPLSQNYGPPQEEFLNNERLQGANSPGESLSAHFFETIPHLSKKELYLLNLYRNRVSKLQPRIPREPTLEEAKSFMQDNTLKWLKSEALSGVSYPRRGPVRDCLVFIDFMQFVGRSFDQREKN